MSAHKSHWQSAFHRVFRVTHIILTHENRSDADLYSICFGYKPYCLVPLNITTVLLAFIDKCVIGFATTRFSLTPYSSMGDRDIKRCCCCELVGMHVNMCVFGSFTHTRVYKQRSSDGRRLNERHDTKPYHTHQRRLQYNCCTIRCIMFVEYRFCLRNIHR